MAHAYNRPAAWCKFSDKLWGDDTKFYDYFLSLNIKCENPIYIKRNLNYNELFEIAKKATNADRKTLEERQKALLESCPFKARDSK